MRDVVALVDGARAGRARDIARLVSLVEDGSVEVPDAMRELAAHGKAAVVIGITGSPGVGKSTTTSALITALRARGSRVGVLAVDPSSPFTGGALLGDRIRMQEHATDEGVFIRSMASRGHLGGLSATTPQALRVLEAAGFDVVLIETVGVGQSEVEVAGSTDTTLVLLAPGMGDGIQAAKAGILEVGDVFAVNKADRDGADATARELRAMIALGVREEGGWTPPVVRTVAATGEGIDALLDALDRHRAWLVESGELKGRRVARAREEVEAIVLAALRRRLASGELATQFDRAAAEVAAGTVDAYTAAGALVERLVHG
ncbi:MAG: methylmalonyl Co-A mutase-associated GTPase MeaB [Candidatus Nanopelagicales bacterium]